MDGVWEWIGMICEDDELRYGLGNECQGERMGVGEQCVGWKKNDKMD